MGDGLGALAALVCFRALPFVGYAVASPRHSRVSKLLLLCSFVGAVSWLLLSRPALGVVLLMLPALYAYLVALALILPSVARAAHGGWIGRFPLSVLLLGTYLVLPAALAPAQLIFPVLILGWESMLKAFSYCVDDGTDGVDLPRRELLFFMLVSPTLVLSQRGIWVGRARLGWHGAVRLLLGVATLALEDVLRRIAVGLPGAYQKVFGTLALTLAYYFSHSGLASMQIGFMRLIGYRVPERYRFPFLASSPSDFWRRWNTWLGSWARRYVFAPTHARLHRRFRGVPALLAHGMAVVAALAAIGLLHDMLLWVEMFSVADTGPISLATTGMFVIFSVVVVLWNAAVRLLRKLGLRAGGRSSASIWGARLAFFPCLLLMYWLAQSALSGRGLPEPLPRLLIR